MNPELLKGKQIKLLSVYQQQRVFFDGSTAKWHFPEDVRQKSPIYEIGVPADG
jgi:hypothetical protein